MPALTQHQSRKVTKLLNLGEPGAGKTGALESLARAGYKLVIADFDNGLDILSNILQDDAEALERIKFETFTDKLQSLNGQVLPVGMPTAFTKGTEAMTRWRFGKPGEPDHYDLGNIGTWKSDTIFVLDSLGLMAVAALRMSRQLNGRQSDRFIHQADYGQAMDAIEGILQLLYSNSIECNVIVNTHISYRENPISGVLRGLPRALGSQLPPKVGGYFNSVVHTLSEGSGRSAKHIIRTVSEPALELKLPIKPGVLPETLPVSTGLLTIFKALQKEDWAEPKEEKMA